jgi:L-ascorbate metabolism protein UlaG (beta-lactamase superfamily)
VYNPLLTGDPNFTAHFRASTRGATHILLTHGHDDHIGDTLQIARETGAEIVANFDLCTWLEGQGAQKINSGDTGDKIPRGNFSVGITDARHSVSTIEASAPVYLGPANGLAVDSADTRRKPPSPRSAAASQWTARWQSSATSTSRP